MLQLTDSSVVYRVGRADEREAVYYAALKLVARIDDDLTRGIRHYRNNAGTILTTLEEVIRAILNDDLMIGRAAQ